MFLNFVKLFKKFFLYPESFDIENGERKQEKKAQVQAIVSKRLAVSSSDASGSLQAKHFKQLYLLCFTGSAIFHISRPQFHYGLIHRDARYTYRFSRLESLLKDAVVYRRQLFHVLSAPLHHLPSLQTQKIDPWMAHCSSSDGSPRCGMHAGVGDCCPTDEVCCGDTCISILVTVNFCPSVRSHHNSLHCTFSVMSTLTSARCTTRLSYTHARHASTC
jgi:hypothetical protein